MDKQAKKQMLAAYKRRDITGGVFAVRNTATGKVLLQWSADLMGSRNRFAFSQTTGSCMHKKLEEDYRRFGADAFVFEVLESLDKKETQTSADFEQEIRMLYDMTLEKMRQTPMY